MTSVAKENGNRTYTVSVEAPDGYSVTVTPSTFTLKKGQSVTFQVQIVNNSAPIGAWRFGSYTLTEANGHYSARSPIAVRGSQFSAVTQVNETGVSGTGSVDVFFGYQR